jgi:hypothetical protein
LNIWKREYNNSPSPISLSAATALLTNKHWAPGPLTIGFIVHNEPNKDIFACLISIGLQNRWFRQSGKTINSTMKFRN